METYEIEVTEVLSRLVKVVASSPEEADRLVREAYRKDDIVLTDADYMDTSFGLYKDE